MNARKLPFYWTILVVGLLVFHSNALAQELTAQQLSETFRSAIQQVKPSVVSINAEKKPQKVEERLEEIPDMLKPFLPEDMLDEEFREKMIPRRGWQGSGVIISESGEVLTNYHVVKDADKLFVKLDDWREMDAEVIATDPSTDIALVQLLGEGPFAAAKLGDSDKLQVGDWVLAIGNPFGLNQSVSEGIVSAKGRTTSDVPIGGEDGFQIKDFIQTTAAINPGNSGGPLINLSGEIIGINNAIQTAGIPANLGIGFAIPSKLAKNVVDSLKEYGKVRRGYMGVGLVDNTDDIAQYYRQEFGINYGALVNKVFPDTAAEVAGLQHGDLILEVDGNRVRDTGHLINMVSSLPVGTEVNLKILRKGEEITKQLVLMERPSLDEITIESESVLKIEVDTLTSELAIQKGYDENLEGVIVVNVETGGPAYRVGIQVDDVITEVNYETIKNVDEFTRILEEFEADMREKEIDEKAILLYLYRADSRLHPKYVAPTVMID